MMRVLVAIGTRPEAIKLAPVIAALRAHPEQFEVRICLTAQHRQMLDHTLEVFGIEGDVDLDVMTANQRLPELTGTILSKTHEVIEREKPELVVVQGDTTTVFAVAMASFYAGVPVAHVEAGLRTGDLAQPYPEEANRRLTSVLADLHFAPTARARENLEREGVPAARIHVTGNTVVDALLSMADRIDRDPELFADLERRLPYGDGRRSILVTGHRRESFGQGFAAICEAIGRLAERHPDIDFVYPVHLNPKVRKPVQRRLGGIENIHLLEPVDYLSFVFLMRRCHLILTDSGGVQEEAPTFDKPVLVMRRKTERLEAVEAGASRLVGTSKEAIEAEVERLLSDPAAYREMSRAVNPFGDGAASQRIRDAILAWVPG